MADHFPTDNTDVSLTPMYGWLMAMTESALFHFLDPHSLQTVASLDLRKAPKKPEFLEILTVTAHGHIDYDGTYWNMGGGMDMRAVTI